ncbi:response regulator [Hymenobacter metallilatus]|uniref:Response regulator n=1 Tax=Hymenobacter metallilatus TaxID=2493666 RepID=A0A3R9NS54_9BACT|nr:response regulator [Hymenobacter metallilatus]RSK35952.1 response regulator [Hymenobacter metallilatus]
MEKLSYVILVDDDDTTNHINESLIRSLGITDSIFTANDGVEALALLEQQVVAPSAAHPALLLLDITMPTMDGMAFLEAYQHLPAAYREAIRIVVLTVNMTSANLARVDDLPVAGLASKPLTAEKMDTILKLHFQRKLSDS